MRRVTTLVSETLHVGIVQTSLDDNAAWVDDGSGDWQKCIRMSPLEERRAKKEIRHYIASLKGMNRHPDIVLLPELAVPLGFEAKLRRIAESLGSIIIAGLDYRPRHDIGHPAVSNEAVVVVPKRVKGKKIAARTGIRRVGKTYPAPGERRKLGSISGGGVAFAPQPIVSIFESPDLGNFAVAICYDFMDLDRIVLYRQRIQTLFILAYNRDTTSFDHLAEAIGRMVFCNVVVCNCGQYGGSLAISPFRKPYKRAVYRHVGQKLPNAQLVELPLEALLLHQTGSASNDFKSLPPGIPNSIALTTDTETL